MWKYDISVDTILQAISKRLGVVAVMAKSVIMTVPHKNTFKFNWPLSNGGYFDDIPNSHRQPYTSAGGMMFVGRMRTLFFVQHWQAVTGRQLCHQLVPLPRQLLAQRLRTVPCQFRVYEGDFFRDRYFVFWRKRNHVAVVVVVRHLIPFRCYSGIPEMRRLISR
jgi:hypothetical protein